MAIYLKDITVKNFRAFSPTGTSVELCIPDGTLGSGLTTLVGENGSGKTTLLESIELLVKNTFAARSRIEVSDFNDFDQAIEISATATEDFAVKRLWGAASSTFNAAGFRFHANLRTRDESARLLDTIALDNEFTPSANLGATSIQDVEKRLGATGPYGADRVPVRVVYLDKNRSRHLVGGKYQTKMDDVLGDLNFQFLKWLRGLDADARAELAEKISGAFSDIHATTGDKVVGDAFDEITELLGDLNLKLDFANLLEPYSGSAIYARQDSRMEQVPVGKLGSGIEMICSLVFLDTIYRATSSTAIYCIDEPEMHLHPQLQAVLYRYLLELSKDKQVIISTHSTEFISWERLAGTTKLVSKSGGVTGAKITADVISKIRPNRNFFERHKALLFAERAVLVEGADDLERYALFAQQNDLADLAPHILMMNGKDAARLYESICKDLDIKFCAIVDMDYCFEQSRWERGKVQAWLRQINREWPAFDIDAFNEAHNVGANTITPRGGSNAPTAIDVDGVTIQKTSTGNIFVLSHGEVRDYLDENGVELDEEKKAELLAMLGKIREVVLG